MAWVLSQVDFRTMFKALSTGTGTVFMQLYLDTAENDIDDALTAGNYPVSTITPGSFPVLTLLQAHLTGVSLLEGGFSSEASDGSNKSYQAWVRKTQAKLAQIRSGKMLLRGSGETENVQPPWRGAPVIQTDGRTKALDMIAGERIPSITPENPDISPDAFPGPADGEGRSPYGE